jgi:hypothetical protein
LYGFSARTLTCGSRAGGGGDIPGAGQHVVPVPPQLGDERLANDVRHRARRDDRLAVSGPGADAARVGSPIRHRGDHDLGHDRGKQCRVGGGRRIPDIDGSACTACQRRQRQEPCKQRRLAHRPLLHA